MQPCPLNSTFSGEELPDSVCLQVSQLPDNLNHGQQPPCDGREPCEPTSAIRSPVETRYSKRRTTMPMASSSQEPLDILLKLLSPQRNRRTGSKKVGFGEPLQNGSESEGASLLQAAAKALAQRRKKRRSTAAPKKKKKIRRRQRDFDTEEESESEWSDSSDPSWIG